MNINYISFINKPKSVGKLYTTPLTENAFVSSFVKSLNAQPIQYC